MSIPMIDMADILQLYHDEIIRPLNNDACSLEFEKVLASFVTLDLHVETEH